MTDALTPELIYESYKPAFTGESASCPTRVSFNSNRYTSLTHSLTRLVCYVGCLLLYYSPTAWVALFMSVLCVGLRAAAAAAADPNSSPAEPRYKHPWRRTSSEWLTQCLQMNSIQSMTRIFWNQWWDKFSNENYLLHLIVRYNLRFSFSVSFSYSYIKILPDCSFWYIRRCVSSWLAF